FVLRISTKKQTHTSPSLMRLSRRNLVRSASALKNTSLSIDFDFVAMTAHLTTNTCGLTYVPPGMILASHMRLHAYQVVRRIRRNKMSELEEAVRSRYGLVA